MSRRLDLTRLLLLIVHSDGGEFSRCDVSTSLPTQPTILINTQDHIHCTSLRCTLHIHTIDRRYRTSVFMPIIIRSTRVQHCPYMCMINSHAYTHLHTYSLSLLSISRLTHTQEWVSHSLKAPYSGQYNGPMLNAQTA